MQLFSPTIKKDLFRLQCIQNIFYFYLDYIIIFIISHFMFSWFRKNHGFFVAPLINHIFVIFDYNLL